MRVARKRLLTLPFISCISSSSIAITRSGSPRKSTFILHCQTQSPNNEKTGGKTKTSSFLQRILHGFKGLSHIFTHGDGDEDEYEEQDEMEIGLPTDVQHVGHIGINEHGSFSVMEMKGVEGAHHFYPYPEPIDMVKLGLREASEPEEDLWLTLGAGIREIS